MSSHHAVKCDKCGATQPIESREGLTCNAGLAGGGYCDGTLQGPAFFAERAKQEAEKPLEVAVQKRRPKGTAGK